MKHATFNTRQTEKPASFYMISYRHIWHGWQMEEGALITSEAEAVNAAYEIGERSSWPADEIQIVRMDGLTGTDVTDRIMAQVAAKYSEYPDAAPTLPASYMVAA